MLINIISSKMIIENYFFFIRLALGFLIFFSFFRVILQRKQKPVSIWTDVYLPAQNPPATVFSFWLNTALFLDTGIIFLPLSFITYSVQKKTNIITIVKLSSKSREASRNPECKSIFIIIQLLPQHQCLWLGIFTSPKIIQALLFQK